MEAHTKEAKGGDEGETRAFAWFVRISPLTVHRSPFTAHRSPPSYPSFLNHPSPPPFFFLRFSQQVNFALKTFVIRSEISTMLWATEIHHLSALAYFTLTTVVVAVVYVLSVTIPSGAHRVRRVAQCGDGSTKRVYERAAADVSGGVAAIRHACCSSLSRLSSLRQLAASSRRRLVLG